MVNLGSMVILNSTLTNYRPKRSFGQGNIFTPVCHSVHRGGVSAPNFRGGRGVPGEVPPRQTPLPPGRHPPGRHPPGRHPPGQAPPRQAPPWQAPPRAGTPPGRHPPWAGTPPGQAPPPGRHPSPRQAPLPPGRHPSPRQTPPRAGTPPGTRSTLGRYASYWNAFLLLIDWLPILAKLHQTFYTISQIYSKIRNRRTGVLHKFVLCYRYSLSCWK